MFYWLTFFIKSSFNFTNGYLKNQDGSYQRISSIKSNFLNFYIIFSQ